MREEKHEKRRYRELNLSRKEDKKKMDEEGRNRMEKIKEKGIRDEI